MKYTSNLKPTKSPSEGGVGEDKKSYCPIKSRLKMVIFTKVGYENKTWYSFLKTSKKDQRKEAQNMIERAKKKYSNIGQTIVVYDNQTKEELLKHNV